MAKDKRSVALVMMIIAILILVVVSIFTFLSFSSNGSSSTKEVSTRQGPSSGNINLVIQRPYDNSTIEGDQLK